MGNPAAIVLIGLAANFPNPGVFPEIDFAQGPSGPAPAARNILIIGNKSTAGTATNDTVVYGPDTATTCQTENDVVTLFGQGSQLHRAFLRITAVRGNTVGPAIYYIAAAPSGGAAATGTIIFTGTATSNANVRVWVVDQFVDTAVTSGQTPTQIGAAVAASINSQFRYPVTAANGAGTVTVTANNTGPEGNWIVCQAAFTSGGSTVTTTITGTIGTANAKLTGGATADNYTNALATVLSTRFYYILCCDSDATNIGRVVTQVNSQALPTSNIRQRVFAGSADTLANEITLATGLNAPRCEISSALGSDLTPLEIAANNMAVYSLLENSGGRVGPTRNNYSLFPANATDASLWTIVGTRSGPTSGLSTTQITSALNNGITPLAILPNNSTQLVKRVTSRSLNGAVQDYRVRDAHRVSIPDFWTDDAVSLTQLNFGGKDLLPDPQQGQPFPPPQATTPAQWGASLKDLVQTYANAGQLKNVTAILNSMIVQRETNPTNRCSALVPLQCVDLADQFALLVQQVA
jgi:phage tail sheath gpL-like